MFLCEFYELFKNTYFFFKKKNKKEKIVKKKNTILKNISKQMVLKHRDAGVSLQ